MKDFLGTYADHVYEIVKEDANGFDSVYADHIESLVGTTGLEALFKNGLIETCGVIRGRQLYVLCDYKRK